MRLPTFPKVISTSNPEASHPDLLSQNRQSRLGISNDDRIGGSVVLDTEIDEDGKKLLHPSDTVRHQLN